MKTCRKCSARGDVKWGSGYYCPKHARFLQMRTDAKSKGKTVPTLARLEAILKRHTRRCPGCGVFMNWLRKHGASTVITLQHDRSGRMRFLCFGCNTSHQFDHGDKFYNRTKGSKECRDCHKEKPLTEFFRDRRVKTGVKSYCKGCSTKRTYRWRRRVKFRGKSNWRIKCASR